MTLSNFARRVALLSLAVMTIARAAFAFDDKDLKQLLDGVKTFGATGSPGLVAVVGDDAFPVIVGRVDDEVRGAVVAATEFGSGRIVAFSHNGYFSQNALGDGDSVKLVANCLRWAAHQARGASPREVVHVRVLGGPEFATFLKSQGFDAEPIDSIAALDKARCDVLVQNGSESTSAADLALLTRWVKHGGGLMVAQTPWGWLQVTHGKRLQTDHAGNTLLMQAGLAWIDGIAGETAKPGYSVEARDLELVDASRAVDALAAKDPATPWTKERIAQARWSILSAVGMLPEDDKLLRPKLAKLRAGHESVVPTAEHPLRDDKPLDRLMLALEIEELLSLPAAKVRAHPAAQSFPGAVAAEAPRVVRSVVVDTQIPRWHSLGLYAAPGEVVEVTLPTLPQTKGCAVQIGSHTDDLTGNDRWSRAPKIVSRATITSETTRIASPFGGLVYIDLPEKAAPEVLTLKLRNVVEAPRYVQGETDLAQWRDKIRALPGPWAELETKRVVITVPSSAVRSLDDPAALMAFWDKVLDACAELGSIPKERPYPQRYVADVQISAGYMHSGYPIMTHLDVAGTFTNLAKLSKDADGCGWGFYHEMGHNHQVGDWTFEGTGEVTNNIFAVYVLDTVVGVEDARTKEAECKKRFDAYQKGGVSFAKWKSDPFLALGFFLEMQRAFGWDAFRKFFAEYRTLKKNEHPQNDDDERDQWLTRMSRITGKNLAPWFELWAIPVRPEAVASVASLPPWMPEGYAPAMKAPAK
jgi:hypothetical protein